MTDPHDEMVAYFPQKVEKWFQSLRKFALGYFRVLALVLFRPLHASWILLYPNRASDLYISPLVALSTSLFLFGLLFVPTKTAGIDFFITLSNRLSPDISIISSVFATLPSLIFAILLANTMRPPLTSLNQGDSLRIRQVAYYALAAQFGGLFLLVLISQVFSALVVHKRMDSIWLTTTMNLMPYIGAIIIYGTPCLAVTLAAWHLLSPNFSTFSRVYKCFLFYVAASLFCSVTYMGTEYVHLLIVPPPNPRSVLTNPTNQPTTSNPPTTASTGTVP